ALLGVRIARHADRFDHADAELARDDRRRNETTAGNADHRFERADAVEPPGERARIPMKLVPRDWKDFLRRSRRRIVPLRRAIRLRLAHSFWLRHCHLDPCRGRFAPAISYRPQSPL